MAPPQRPKSNLPVAAGLVLFGAGMALFPLWYTKTGPTVSRWRAGAPRPALVEPLANPSHGRSSGAGPPCLTQLGASLRWPCSAQSSTEPGLTAPPPPPLSSSPPPADRLWVVRTRCSSPTRKAPCPARPSSAARTSTPPARCGGGGGWLCHRLLLPLHRPSITLQLLHMLQDVGIDPDYHKYKSDPIVGNAPLHPDK